MSDRYVEAKGTGSYLERGTIYKVLAETPYNYVINIEGVERLITKEAFYTLHLSYGEIRKSFTEVVKACGGVGDYNAWKGRRLDEVLATLAPNGVRFYYDKDLVEK